MPPTGAPAVVTTRGSGNGKVCVVDEGDDQQNLPGFRFDFFEVVEVVDSQNAPSRCDVVVLGKTPVEPGYEQRTYAVARLDETGRSIARGPSGNAFMIEEGALRPTGRRLDRRAIYGS